LTDIVNSSQATSIAVNYIYYKNISFDFWFMVYILVTSTVLLITLSSQLNAIFWTYSYFYVASGITGHEVCQSQLRCNGLHEGEYASS